MLQILSRWLRIPTPTELAHRELQDYQRALVLARCAQQFAAHQVRYYEGAINELQRTLRELSNEV